MTITKSVEGVSCPPLISHRDKIILGHGSGGKLTHDLITKIFKTHFRSPYLLTGNDAASIPADNSKLAISTDAHVVSPLFFPGGDIGRLAVCGTINDVSMIGAIPRYLTASFIIEEGLDIDVLVKIAQSMKEAAIEANVEIIAGDTKVVQKGKGDGLFISTTGIGFIYGDTDIGGQFAQPGDQVILSGTIGDHGVAVLEARGELGFSSTIKSDVAPLNHMIKSMLDISDNIHVLRDPTRGGLGTTLNEIASQSDVCILINHEFIPVNPQVNAVCEILGFDPIYLANEGKLIAIVSSKDAQIIVNKIKESPYGTNARIIGEVIESPKKKVLMKTGYGTTRIIDMLSSELLPRIC